MKMYIHFALILSALVGNLALASNTDQGFVGYLNMSGNNNVVQGGQGSIQIFGSASDTNILQDDGSGSAPANIKISGSNNTLQIDSGEITIVGNSNIMQETSGQISIQGNGNYVNGSNLNVTICGNNYHVYQSGTYGSCTHQNYKMGWAASNDTLWSPLAAIDGSLYSSYSSQYFPTSSNTRNSYLAAWNSSGLEVVSQVALGARMYNSAPLGFATQYDIYLTSADNARWDYVGTYSATLQNGIATIGLNASYLTYGVLIVPKVLGVDNYNNHYFQLAELWLKD